MYEPAGRNLYTLRAGIIFKSLNKGKNGGFKKIIAPFSAKGFR